MVAPLAEPPAAAAAAPAPLRSPVEQERLAALAEALGRAHALHRRCTGAADDRWRAPMQRLLQVEHATPALRDRLVRRFNAGFAAAQASFPACSGASEAALKAAAAEGRDLAASLGRESLGSPAPATP